MVRPSCQVFTKKILRVVGGALVKLAFTTNTDMIANHVPWHAVGCHGCCHGWGSLLYDCPLLYLNRLIYDGHTRLVLIVVVSGVHDDTLASIKHDCICILRV